jgi:hypothetical protein
VDFGRLLDVESYLDLQTSVAIASSLLLWVALVHVVMAAGSRHGDLVWSARQPRRLDPALRARSFVFVVLIVASVGILLSETGWLDLPTVPPQWSMSAMFVVTAFLGVATIYNIGWGSTWERVLFAPIAFLGALLAGWLAFG